MRPCFIDSHIPTPLLRPVIGQYVEDLWADTVIEEIWIQICWLLTRPASYHYSWLPNQIAFQLQGTEGRRCGTHLYNMRKLRQDYGQEVTGASFHIYFLRRLVTSVSTSNKIGKDCGDAPQLPAESCKLYSCFSKPSGFGGQTFATFLIS